MNLKDFITLDKLLVTATKLLWGFYCKNSNTHTSVCTPHTNRLPALCQTACMEDQFEISTKMQLKMCRIWNDE